MYGIEAIQANNGWAISVVGISIVFAGLVLLALIISQLYKVLDLWDHRGALHLFRQKEKPEKTAAAITVFTDAQKESARQFRLLIKILEDDFSLPRLLNLAVISGIDHPYSSLSHLVKSQIIIPNGDGYFRWNHEMFDKIISY